MLSSLKTGGPRQHCCRLCSCAVVCLIGEATTMSSSGTSTFIDPHDYQAMFREGRINLVLTKSVGFKARQTWVEFGHLHLVRNEENLPRIAFVSLAPERVFVGFPSKSVSLPTWGGMKLTSGDIVLHGRGERMHYRTSGTSSWGYISVAPEHLVAYRRAIAGFDLAAPSVGRILRPPGRAKGELVSLHAQACYLAETKSEMIAHPEVVRSLEQQLAHALVTCLVADEVYDPTPTKRHRRSIMARFEKVLEERLDRPLRMPDVCAAIDVSQRTLRTCCAEFLGLPPALYIRLRRLNVARGLLRHADPDTTSVAKIARRSGFSELGRFAAIYRTAFGEWPSATLAFRPSLVRHTYFPEMHRPT
jgi:AraC-like DNA-binding protein